MSNILLKLYLFAYSILFHIFYHLFKTQIYQYTQRTSPTAISLQKAALCGLPFCMLLIFFLRKSGFFEIWNLNHTRHKTEKKEKHSQECLGQ